MTTTSKTATLTLGETSVDLPVLSGSTGPDVIDIRKLYAATDAWVCTRIYEQLLRTPKKPIRK